MSSFENKVDGFNWYDHDVMSLIERSNGQNKKREEDLGTLRLKLTSCKNKSPTDPNNSTKLS